MKTDKFFNGYPYTNYHELNLDYFITKIQSLEKEIKDFMSFNSLEWAYPIFWDISQNYEKNKIVVDKKTNYGYVSIKPVPSGVPISDDKYWSEIFSFVNSVIDVSYENDKITFLTQNTTETTDEYVTVLNVLGHDFKIKDNELWNSFDALTNSFNNYKGKTDKRLDNLERKKRVILIGDSYSEGYTPDGNVKSWSDIIVSSFPKIDFINLRLGGSGFVNGTTFLQQLQNANIEDHGTIDEIYLVGGYNDIYYNTGVIESAIKTFSDYVGINYVNATVYIGFCGNYTKDSSNVSKFGTVYYAYKNSCLNSANLNYIDNLQYVLLNSTYFSSDGFHPNLEGQKVLAGYLKEFINNKKIDVQSIYVQNTFSSLKVNENIMCGMQMYNNTLTFKMVLNRLSLKKPTHCVLDGNNFIELGTFSNSLITGSNSDLSCVNTSGFVQVGSDYYNTSINFVIKNNKLYARLLCVISNNFLSGTVNVIGFNSFAFSMESQPII